MAVGLQKGSQRIIEETFSNTGLPKTNTRVDMLVTTTAVPIHLHQFCAHTRRISIDLDRVFHYTNFFKTALSYKHPSESARGNSAGGSEAERPGGKRSGGQRAEEMSEGHEQTPRGAIKAFRLEMGCIVPPICLPDTRRMDVANGTVMAGYGIEPVTAFSSTLGPTDNGVQMKHLSSTDKQRSCLTDENCIKKNKNDEYRMKR
ncbi:hypothetical protein IRJ41_000124 [Triplophysa rosa]|uniref:Uncharacterized protein n=1 Tax=Triplophysa rosa TaxID=992332 RepID=A0A9W7TDD3_TRIRA|nr:hypothetical protein IRJ41_000124 [Triplophysa rosa]